MFVIIVNELQKDVDQNKEIICKSYGCSDFMVLAVFISRRDVRERRRCSNRAWKCSIVSRGWWAHVVMIKAAHRTFGAKRLHAPHILQERSKGVLN